MTDNEHKLILFMFTKQLTVMKAMLEALKSKGVFEHDDLTAYEQMVNSQPAMTADLLIAATMQYKAYAKLLGIETGLPD
jgi:hypothetical protein